MVPAACPGHDPHDRRATFVPLDSKENFDENFSSNWYYCWK